MDRKVEPLVTCNMLQNFDIELGTFLVISIASPPFSHIFRKLQRLLHIPATITSSLTFPFRIAILIERNDGWTVTCYMSH